MISETVRCRTTTAIWVLACLCATLWMVHYPMLSSRLALTQTDPGDSRLANYFLEHGYRWLAGAKHHEHFWDPPFFYPHPNVGAYASLMAGAGPLYWPWRMAGIAADTSFQWWMLAMTAANMLAAYFFLRRVIKVGVFSAGVAAAFFAGANSLATQLGHQQLYCQIYVLGMIATVMDMFRPPEADIRRNATLKKWLNPAVFAACLVLQLYSEFYGAFFVSLALGVALACSLVRRESRSWVVGVLKAHVLPLALSGGLAVLAMIPWLTHYMAVMNEVGGRDWDEVRSMLPRIQSWIYMGPWNWVYGGTAQWSVFKGLPMEHEHRLGLGLVTTVVCGAGLWLHRRLPMARIMLATVAVLMCLVTQFLPQIPVAWELVYGCVPGAKAIRGVARIGLLLRVPAAIGMAWLLDYLYSNRGRRFHLSVGRTVEGEDHRLGKRGVPLGVVAFVAGFVCMVEQISIQSAYDKAWMRGEVARIAREVRPDCQAFFYTENRREVVWWRPHVDAMWAGLEVGKPTINGFSGNVPPQWKMINPTSYSAYRTRKNGQYLRVWMEKSHLDPLHIQWIGQVETPLSVVLLPDTEVKMNDTPGVDMLGDGWSMPEPSGVWSDGTEASLAFEVPPEVCANGHYRLRLKFHTFAPKPGEFRCGLSLNGDPVCDYRTPQECQQEVFIERSAAELRPRNLLRFQFNARHSPKELGLGNDDRKLGIFLCSITLESIDPRSSTRRDGTGQDR